MNNPLILEILVVALGLGILLADLWLPEVTHKRRLGWLAAAGLALIFALSLNLPSSQQITAFGGMYVMDGLALYFKQFFLLAAFLVVLITMEFAGKILAGISEFYALTLFALAGMMFAASANDFSLLFVSLELVTVTFYVLNSFQRGKARSLEAGVKYLVIGALSAAFMIYGIALIFGATGSLNFDRIADKAWQFSVLAKSNGMASDGKIFVLGVLLVFVGLAFKIAAFPAQMWAPDVYEGAPAPATAFLATGSKAVGFVLLLRLLYVAVPAISADWMNLFIGISMATILYGNLCAIPQRNIKRLFGYSSIANAGYILMGVAVMTAAGQAAILYYLGAYLFAVLGAFTVLAVLAGQNEGEDVTVLAGLNQRSPLMAATLTLSMVSLAGIPPLAGFFGKFLLLKAVVEQGAAHPALYWLAAVAILGVIISLYYYFGVVRAIYWPGQALDLQPIKVSVPAKISLYICAAGMLFLGIYPNALVEIANHAVSFLATAQR